MNHDLLRRWVEASHALGRLQPHMVVAAQGLGKLEVRLRAEDSRFNSGVVDSDAAIAFAEHLTLSYLWVLGGYELVRAVAERRGKDVNRVPESIGVLKKSFERLRIPLAKFEPARAHRGTDSEIAWPVIGKALGVAWQVAPDTFISRNELADELLEFLEKWHAAERLAV